MGKQVIKYLFIAFIIVAINHLTPYDEEVLFNYCFKNISCTTDTDCETKEVLCQEASNDLVNDIISYDDFEQVRTNVNKEGSHE